MRILITAGPTHEPIDPVRYLGNRSSGKMGYAIAAAAVARGHQAVLVSGPTALDPADGVDLVAVESAAQMYEAVAARIGECDAAVMAAAVADYTPKAIADHKIKKSDGSLTLELVRTRDILGSMRDPLGFEGVLIGFAAETENMRANALGKLARKGCDYLVANDVSRSDIGFGSDDNEVILFSADGNEQAIDKAAKAAIAAILIETIESHPAKPTA